MSRARRLMVGAIITATTALSPAAADVKTGVEAWQAGNFPAAIREWRPLAEQGDADAQFNLGQAYKLGRGVPADLKMAQSWYEKAAKQNHEEAQANLGLILFQNGEQEAGMVWIRKAADNGDPRARYVLGTALFNGDMMAKDWPRAYALMNRAAAQGLTAAADSLSQMENVMPESQRQEGMKLVRELARKDADREAGPVQIASARPNRQAPAPTLNQAPAQPARPPEPAPPAAPPKPVDVAVAPTVVAPPAPEPPKAEQIPVTPSQAPVDVAAAASPPPAATGEAATPTWSVRKPKRVRTARPRAAQRSEPALAPAMAAPAPVEVAAADAPIAAAPPVETAAASLPATPQPDEALGSPTPSQQPGEFAAQVAPASPAPASLPEATTPPTDAVPSTSAAPPQPVELASAAPADAPPAPEPKLAPPPVPSEKPVSVTSETPTKRAAAVAKPAPKSPMTPLTSAGGRWRVQLGAYGTVDLAKGQWTMLSRKSSTLAGLKPSYEPFGALTRLRVTALTDRSAAEKVCAAAKAVGQACFPIAP